MRFWDSSATVVMLAAQDGSKDMLELLREDGGLAVWWGTHVECMVAINRLSGEGLLNPVESEQSRARLVFLSRNWFEIEPSEHLRRIAVDLSFKVSLKAADILQLAAANVWRGGDAPEMELVCLDRRLCRVARDEGFTVLPGALA